MRLSIELGIVLDTKTGMVCRFDPGDHGVSSVMRYTGIVL